MLLLSFSPHSREYRVLPLCPNRHYEHFLSAILRRVARNIGVLEQIASTVEWLRSFWNARVHTVSANPNVRVTSSTSPSCLSITSSTNSSTTVSASGSLAGKIAVTRNITPSIRMARRKTWSEGVAERRGPKTCLLESRTWNQLALCALQLNPSAFSCMTVTLHTGEALVLIHSHANSEKARASSTP